MYCILVIGAPRQGKSNYCKTMITHPKTINKPCYVFDPRNEYGATYRTNINKKIVEVPGVGLVANRPELPRSRYTGTKNGIDKEFFKQQAAKKKNSIVIFEESTGFLKGRIPDDMNDLLTGRFHSNNTYILVFHSLETVPPDIIRNNSADRLVLFTTVDNVAGVDTKFKNPYITAGLKMQLKKPPKSLPTIIHTIDGIIDGKPYDRADLEKVNKNLLF